MTFRIVLANRGKLRAISADAFVTTTRDFSIEKTIDGFESAIRFANGRRGR
ncbi:MAG: hypothetical protein JNM86_13325 [Phycisphaerae bacterium]|nr:hypothetical protein [Phycisphaerae bacterium]